MTRVITLDFETYYADDYTLSKMTTEAYVRDPRFQALCMSVCYPSGQSETAKGKADIQRLLSHIGQDVICIAQHAHFDGLILSHHFNWRPALWIDTLSMARQVLGPRRSHSLGAMAKTFGFEEKTVPYNLFKGRRLENLDTATLDLLTQGCVQDCRLTEAIAKELLKSFPKAELPMVDMTVRMFTEPTLVGDTQMYRALQVEEWERKGQRLLDLGVTNAQLQSADAFVALLTEAGVEVEYKDGKHAPIPAISKTDAFMRTLLDDPDDYISGLAEARLDVKSTISETRAGRLADMSERGPLTVYLNYCGAHTTRWSGGDKVNFQNFPRGGNLRKAIVAPKGYKLAVVDLSQIECRVLNHLAGQSDIVEAFASGRDLYSEGATRFYGRTITKADKLERHLGKTLELGCGFGMGTSKFKVTCGRGALGGPRILLTDEEAFAAVSSYRNSHQHVVAYWKQAGFILDRLQNPSTNDVWGPFKVRNHKLILPNGGWIDYSGITWDDEENNYKVPTRHGYTRIYGAKLVENVVQALSRVVMSDAMLRIRAKGLRIVTTTHDEVVVLVPDTTDAEAVYKEIEADMVVTPSYLPGIPLAAEGGLYDRYEK